MTSLASHRSGRTSRGRSGSRTTWPAIVAIIQSDPAWAGVTIERSGDSRYKIQGAPCALRNEGRFTGLDVEALEEHFAMAVDVRAGDVRRAFEALTKKDNGADVAPSKAATRPEG